MNNMGSKVIFGSFFVLLGMGFLLELFLPNFNFGRLFASFWPLIFVFAGVASIINNLRNPFFGVALSGFGVLLILGNLFEFNVWRLWPIILIGIGLSIIFDNGARNWRSGSVSEEDDVNVSAIFWGAEKRIHSESFKGGNVNVIFGGADIDLRDAKIAKDGANLDLNTVFGGISIRVPEDMKVIVKGAGFFGAFEDKTYTKKETKGGTLTITGSAVFGGVEVK